MAANVTNPLNLQAVSYAGHPTPNTTGWTSAHFMGIYNSLITQMNAQAPRLLVALEASMPRSDLAAAELRDMLGQV
jgi:hypothetical protein